MNRDVMYEKGRKILEKTLLAIDIWCEEISGDTLCECYCTYSVIEFYDAAIQFNNWSRVNITDEDIEFLEELPDNVYEQLEREYHVRLGKIVDEICEDEYDNYDNY